MRKLGLREKVNKAIWTLFQILGCLIKAESKGLSRLPGMEQGSSPYQLLNFGNFLNFSMFLYQL